VPCSLLRNAFWNILAEIGGTLLDFPYCCLVVIGRLAPNRFACLKSLQVVAVTFISSR